MSRRRCSRCGGKGWVRDPFAYALTFGAAVAFDKISSALMGDDSTEMTRESCPKCGGDGEASD